MNPGSELEDPPPPTLKIASVKTEIKDGPKAQKKSAGGINREMKLERQMKNLSSEITSLTNKLHDESMYRNVAAGKELTASPLILVSPMKVTTNTPAEQPVIESSSTQNTNADLKSEVKKMGIAIEKLIDVMNKKQDHDTSDNFIPSSINKDRYAYSNRNKYGGNDRKDLAKLTKAVRMLLETKSYETRKMEQILKKHFSPLELSDAAEILNNELRDRTRDQFMFLQNRGQRRDSSVHRDNLPRIDQSLALPSLLNILRKAGTLPIVPRSSQHLSRKPLDRLSSLLVLKKLVDPRVSSIDETNDDYPYRSLESNSKSPESSPSETPAVSLNADEVEKKKRQSQRFHSGDTRDVGPITDRNSLDGILHSAILKANLITDPFQEVLAKEKEANLQKEREEFLKVFTLMKVKQEEDKKKVLVDKLLGDNFLRNRGVEDSIMSGKGLQDFITKSMFANGLLNGDLARPAVTPPVQAASLVQRPSLAQIQGEFQCM